MNGLYRGERIDDRELVTGYYLKVGDHNLIFAGNPNIIEPELIGCSFDKVDPSSIAAYTGIDDKNGTPIYGSIEIDGKMTKGGDDVIFNEDESLSPLVGIVEYEKNKAAFWVHNKDEQASMYIWDGDFSGSEPASSLEVISKGETQ